MTGDLPFRPDANRSDYITQPNEVICRGALWVIDDRTNLVHAVAQLP